MYDAVLKNIIRHNKKTEELGKRVDAAKKVNPPHAIDELRIEINELELLSRKRNLEVHGVTKSDNENLFEKVNKVTFRLQLSPLTVKEVIAVHRLPAKPGKVPRIIICLARQATKTSGCWERSLMCLSLKTCRSRTGRSFWLQDGLDFVTCGVGIVVF